MFDNIKKWFAENISVPAMKLLPTQNYMTWGNGNTKAKRTLPKNPTIKQLRQFSRDPIVRRAITIVQDAIARQPYTIDVIGGRGKYTKQINALKAIIECPNVLDSRDSFTKRIIDDAMVVDAMCVEIAVSSNSNHPVYLYPIDGSTIQMLVPVDYADENAIRYAQQQENEMKYFTANEVAYIQRNYFTYQPYGLSPVLMSYQYIKYYLDAIDQANMRATNATADMLISLGNSVSAEEKDRFIQYFEEEIQGTGTIPVIAGSDTVSTKQIRGYSGDQSYLAWQDKLTQIIGVAFNLPPEKLGLMVANDRSTGEDQENAMMEECIKPYANMFADLINFYVIPAMGCEGILKFRFIYEDSEQQKANKSKRLLDEYYKGAITENEFRNYMGYEFSESKYADVTYPEKTVMINVDNGIVGGFRGVGGLLDTSASEAEGGEKNGEE